MFKYSKLFSAIALSAGMIASGSAIASPVDHGVVNQERILYWLEKRGELAKDATPEQKKAALAKYIGSPKHADKKIPNEIKKMVAAKKAALKADLMKKGRATENTEVKVLAILVDFPDLPHDNNRLTRSDTSMYYSSYPKEHYKDLLFSTTGYAGPSGQNIESAYQYYKQESGDTFTFAGDVYGWVRASKNAAEYGAHEGEGDDEDKDKDVPALVKEAVEKAVSELGVNLADFDHTSIYDHDRDGNLDEGDKIIDHVMIFHSSVGEEAGGGVLGDDAIWSHRYYVFDQNNQPVNIAGSDVKLFGYTINPIDAATGVVVHEFGHDLGLPDEYDLKGSDEGEPVNMWSVMSAGSWAGSPSGTKPISFSPWARDYLQTTYGGNWINQETIDFNSITGIKSLDLVDAVTHQGTNQVKITLPPSQNAFYAPFEGNGQYYSGRANNYTASLKQSVTLPASGTSSLSFMAHWNIEADWDYVKVKVDGTALKLSHTKTTNQHHENLGEHITGSSKALPEAQGDAGWVNVTGDLSAYNGKTVEIEIVYITDEATTEYGFVVDNLTVTNGENVVASATGEGDDTVTLSNFKQISSTVDGDARAYYVQLRSHKGTDSGLQGRQYSPGVVVWYRNDGHDNNNVGEHAGEGFIGVVDTDQREIKSGTGLADSGIQIRDAALSIFDQKAGLGDSDLSAISKFSDSEDYSFSQQPESGLVLPKLGLAIEVVDQATDSTTASIQLTRGEVAVIKKPQVDGFTVTFTMEGTSLEAGDTITWNFGDGNSKTTSTPSTTHTYDAYGDYTVTGKLTRADSSTLDLESQTVVIAEPISAATIGSTIDAATVAFNVAVTGGKAPFTYAWSFGDGQSSTAESPSVTYAKSSTYDVAVTVTDSAEQSFTSQTKVTVSVPMTVNATASANELAVTFKATVSGGDGAYTYAWDFGDGNTSKVASPSHTYGQDGSYTYKVVVTDGKGVSQEKSGTVSVKKKVVTESGGGSGGSLPFGLLALLSGVTLVRRFKK